MLDALRRTLALSLLSLCAVPNHDAGCGYVNPESRKNRCGPDTARILLLGRKKNTVTGAA